MLRAGSSGPLKRIMSRLLLVFDFDHTIINENSDVLVQELAPNGKIPPHIKSLYTDRGWTPFMREVFVYLHQNEVTSSQIQNFMKALPFAPGMPALLSQLLQKQDSIEAIIISDSNECFIQTILDDKGYTSVFEKVFTNPASFDADGILRLKPYHQQDWCDLCTTNLCKGSVMEEHISEATRNGNTFDCIAYIGDGSNEICPSLRLSEHDIVFPREGYRLQKKLKEYQNRVKCQVVSWEDAGTIWSTLQKYL